MRKAILYIAVGIAFGVAFWLTRPAQHKTEPRYFGRCTMHGCYNFCGEPMEETLPMGVVHER